MTLVILPSMSRVSKSRKTKDIQSDLLTGIVNVFALNEDTLLRAGNLYRHVNLMLDVRIATRELEVVDDGVFLLECFEHEGR